jgi:ubiquinone biosynthesis protein COQ4
MQATELGRLAVATVRVLVDSEQTAEIHVAEELTGRGPYARLRDALFASGPGRELLRARPELRSDQVDFDALRRLPADTLGNAYISHLDRNGLAADSQAAPTRYVEDPELAYLMRRFRQTHDVWHALVGLGTAGHEEVILHAFSYGQLRLPVSALVVVFGAAKHIVLEGRWNALRRGLAEAYRHGRDAAPLLPVWWEREWADRLDAVRSRYGIRPCTRAWVEG